MVVAGAFAAPYILPAGRLFAGTGQQLAPHVVYILFAGGVRQQESMLKRYLADSQNKPIEGNILYNMLDGAPPLSKIVYGTSPQGQPGGSQPIPQILSQTLQQQGTIFPEVRFSKSGTGHYTGLNTALTGNYTTGQGLKQRPVFPTVFEYLRRHTDTPATKTWFIGNTIGNSVPLLNYSNHPSYGEKYGCNFFSPTTTFGYKGQEFLSNAKVYHPEEQMEPIVQMRDFLNNAYLTSASEIPGIKNTEEEKDNIREFMKLMFQKTAQGGLAMPPVADNGDLATVGYACEVMKWFKPALTVINMSSVDSCHGSFTAYLASLHRADHAVGHVWNYIQTQIPEMANNTVMIVTPDHGRNLNPNPILDINNWKSFDHDSDANSRRVFTLMAGPGVDSNLMIGSEANPVGDSADGVLTIAEVLGFKQDIQNQGLIDGSALSLFDRY